MNISYKEILQLLEFVEESNVQFLEVQYGDVHIVADRSGGASRVVPSSASSSVETQPAPVPAPAAPATPSSVAVPAPPTAAAAQARPSGHVSVHAPAVGVFYSAPEPGALPFVELGSRVEKGQQVGIIEVMKVFTSVAAPVSGVVTEILVANEEFVEFDAELVIIAPEGDA